AASSEGGRTMLERGHQLEVGKVGMVGHVAATGEPRIALDVGTDAVFFDNPDLPDTRSAMTLPLKVRGQVIGALDVQSTQSTAFSKDDVAVLQTMADQLATAIANARLFHETRVDAQRRALISEMLQAAATSLDLDELLHRAGETISGYLNVPSAVFAWEAEERSLRPVAFHTADAADILVPEGFDRVTREMNAVLFDVLKERRTSILDATDEVGGPLTRVIGQAEVQSAIYVPLASRAQELGVLGLGAVEGQSLMTVEFAELLGANLSVAMENARLYQEAVHTAERLAEVDRLKSQFLANMSHELRTPLNSIIGFSRVILKEIDGPLTDMQRTDLEAVYNSGQHLLGLINDILEVAKIDSGKMELVSDVVNLQEIVRGVMSTAIALIKDKPGIKLQQAVPKDLPTIIGDTRRIRQAILNLVSNAAKFTQEGFIRVGVEIQGDEVIISVADSGIGIPPDKIDVIFEPFTQADSSTTREAGGTGLGLSITSSFVKMHSGRLWVESEVGEGSTFYMALPIQGIPLSEEEMEEEQLGPGPEPEQKTILCVEDDDGVITLFRRYLSKQGYRVVGLTDSTVAGERARELQPFAITLDVMMPGKDGWQVIQELKADSETCDIPVIMCTIVGEKEYGLSLGAAGYLLKPILEHDLLAALNRLDREDGQHLVLVVDDQPDDRKLLRRMIETQEGYRVMDASGGQEAIAAIQRTPPDIIILDLMMPNVDGFAVLEAVKTDKDTRSIPIVVVTAKELTKEEREILNSGVEALLQKGLFKQQELLADVAEALGRLRDKVGEEQG
ncbi:MAG: response regulator, partial [Chloroflexota bacterium]|nr:response regulator [Chloroflexota bacterium]